MSGHNQEKEAAIHIPWSSHTYFNIATSLLRLYRKYKTNDADAKWLCCVLQLWLPNGHPQLATELGAAAPNSDATTLPDAGDGAPPSTPQTNKQKK